MSRPKWKHNYKLYAYGLDAPADLVDEITAYSQKTGIPKLVIARVALDEWAERNLRTKPKTGKGASVRG
jgi:hypothetical protein